MRQSSDLSSSTVYYRDEAHQARELALTLSTGKARDMLLRLASDYDELADDIEANARETRHPCCRPELPGPNNGAV